MFKLPLLKDIYSSKMAELDGFIKRTTEQINNLTNDLNVLKMFSAAKLNSDVARRYLTALDSPSSAEINSLYNEINSELEKATENLTAAKWLKQLFDRIGQLKTTDIFSMILCLTPPLMTETVDPIDPLKTVVDYNLLYPLLLIPTDKIPSSLVRTNIGKNLDKQYIDNSAVSTGETINEKTANVLTINGIDYGQILCFKPNYNQQYGGKTESLKKLNGILLTEKAVWLDDLTNYFQTETETETERSTTETECRNNESTSGE